MKKFIGLISSSLFASLLIVGCASDKEKVQAPKMEKKSVAKKSKEMAELEKKENALKLIASEQNKEAKRLADEKMQIESQRVALEAKKIALEGEKMQIESSRAALEEINKAAEDKKKQDKHSFYTK